MGKINNGVATEEVVAPIIPTENPEEVVETENIEVKEIEEVIENTDIEEAKTTEEGESIKDANTLIEEEKVVEKVIIPKGKVTILGIKGVMKGKEYFVTSELATTLIKKGAAELKNVENL